MTNYPEDNMKAKTTRTYSLFFFAKENSKCFFILTWSTLLDLAAVPDEFSLLPVFLNKQIPPTYQYLKTLKIWVGKQWLRTFFLMPHIWSHTAERRVKLKSYWSTSLLQVIEKITACIPNPSQTDGKWLFKVTNTSISFFSLFVSSYVVRGKEGWSQNSLGFTSFFWIAGY